MTYAEVAKHVSADDAWFILNDQAYDVTTFLSEHPGGSQVTLEYMAALSLCNSTST